MNIAMWSGPRNISTAMMRSWENRNDTRVVDEPFYAYYLEKTGKSHPGREEVIRQGETDWNKIIRMLTDKRFAADHNLYQKHMAHHLLTEVDRHWLPEVTHGFLIRDPREVLISYCDIGLMPTVADTGIPQQYRLFESICQACGTVPPVIDAKDILKDPQRILSKLCDGLGVSFSEAMLSWPPGPRHSDGSWAKYWYGQVECSTGFEGYKKKKRPLPESLFEVYEQCRFFYNRLYQLRIR